MNDFYHLNKYRLISHNTRKKHPILSFIYVMSRLALIMFFRRVVFGHITFKTLLMLNNCH